jgi:TolB-like protein/class 3 adenylate cyclase/Flp pilus assembly protein TadD
MALANEPRRKLAAILSADAVGYSRLMQADEAATVATLNAYRAAMRGIIEHHKGRVVNAPGDALLAEFPSVVEAVSAAVKIQQNLEGRNMELAPERRMPFRIGVNLGDVIEQDDGTIYGDGVNIAARMEALAEGGGVCVSSSVHDAVEGKLALGFDFLGEQRVKNIAKPVRVYRVRSETRAEPSPAKSARHGKWLWPAVAGVVMLGVIVGIGLLWHSGPSQPDPSMAGRTRIAVLPFANISADAGDEYFADGMTEELISRLSRISGLEVIARTSVMSYKGTTKKIAEIGHELNVGTVLEGSVRKQGDKLRVTAQLIGVDNEAHLWAEDYDRDLKGVFAIQKDIAERVATAMAARLGAAKLVAREPARTQNIDAYNAYLRGRFHLNKASVDGVLKAIDYFEEATHIDPSWPVAYAALADAYEQLPIQDDGYSKEVYPKARAAALKALELDGSLAEAHTALAVVHTFNDRDWAAADNAFKRALELNPNSAATHWWYAAYLLYLRRFDEGIRATRRALELDPVSIAMNVDLAWALEYPGRFDEGLQQANKALEMDPNNPNALSALGWMYLGKGMFKEAEAAFVREVELFGRDPPWVLGDLVAVYAMAGDTARALVLLDEIRQSSKPASGWTLVVAYLPLARRDERYRDELFKSLEQSYDERSFWLSHTSNVWFKPFHSDPRWVAFRDKLGLPP